MEKVMKEPKRCLANMLGTMMNRAAMTLLLAVCTMTAGATGFQYFHLTADGGTTNISGQPYGMAVDANLRSVWCVNELSDPESISVSISFHTDQLICPLSYVFTTGADNTTCTGRNPKSWRILAKQKESDGWSILAEVSNDNTMHDVNTMDYEFYFNSNLQNFKYFAFEFKATQGAHEFQLGEIQIGGFEACTTVNLSQLGGDYTASGVVAFTGTAQSEKKVKIAEDASVILNGVNIIKNDYSNTLQFLNSDGPCIECLGNATIYLANGTTNTLVGHGMESPGIKTGPSGSTLTIMGPGSLDVTGENTIGSTGNIVVQNNVGNLLVKKTSGHYCIGSADGTVTIAGIEMGNITDNTFRYNSSNTLLGSGTETDPYLIYGHFDWRIFSNMIILETDIDKYYKLGGDMTVIGNVMIGKNNSGSGKPFCGVFDGDGHTLTVNYDTESNYCAPFSNVLYATIKNLRVSGTIKTNGQYAGGIVGRSENINNITNCISDVEINSTINGPGYHGGLVGTVLGNQQTTITGCSFIGSITFSVSNLIISGGQTTYDITTHCGGFVGLVEPSGKAVIKDCLFMPVSLPTETEGSNTFACIRNDNSTVDLQNCFYKRAFGTAQGDQVYSFTFGENVKNDDLIYSSYFYDVSQLHFVTLGKYFSDDPFAELPSLQYDIFDENNFIFNGGNGNNEGSGFEFRANGIILKTQMGLITGNFCRQNQEMHLAYSGTVPAGYNFDNKYNLGNGTVSDAYFKMPGDDVTITAKFDIIHYKLTYNLGGGTVATDNPTSYTIESDDITLVNPTLDDFYFGGWTGTDLNEPTQTVTIPKGSMGDRSYRAAFVRTELADGLDYDLYVDVNVPSATYKKTLGSERIGKHQAWFLPFDYTITDADTEKFSFYKLNMIANSPAPGESSSSDEMWVFVTPIGAGTVLHANMPYVYKPKVAVTNYPFTTDNATMKVPETGIVGTMQTMEDTYNIYGTYSNTSPSDADPFYYANIDGEFSLGNESTVVVGPYRWIIRKTSKYGGTTAYARRMYFYDGESDQTGIQSIDEQYDEAGAWFTLDGRRLTGKPAKGGLYVVNGKKVVVK